MTKIQCSCQTTTTVGGTAYAFEADEQGRFIADVPNDKHADIFLAAADHYSLVKDEVEVDAPAPATPSAAPPAPVITPPVIGLTLEQQLAAKKAAQEKQAAAKKPKAAKTETPKKGD